MQYKHWVNIWYITNKQLFLCLNRQQFIYLKFFDLFVH